MHTELMSTAEVARTLNVSRSTVTRMAQAGSLRPAAKSPGIRGARLFDPFAVESLARQRKAGKR